ncbi:conserved membrane hypothetical protein [Paraburkholderia unamae]|uniref:hypothetical protein n=1 Tax=Paraburkholderia unamae TaxID=219649 RepID=UPI001CAC560C|nr:hypothetical protein [Paraburkholderia unamae]CAG9274718.1 conserved membrane hypothetical protein [Paraburkholderia unamae]
MHAIWLFFAGVFFCNALPHLASGLQGLPFPTPFARPRGRGDSSPVVNVVWGFVNLVIALVFAMRDPARIGTVEGALAALSGGLAIGLFLATHFGKVQREKRAE